MKGLAGWVDYWSGRAGDWEEPRRMEARGLAFNGDEVYLDVFRTGNASSDPVFIVRAGDWMGYNCCRYLLLGEDELVEMFDSAGSAFGDGWRREGVKLRIGITSSFTLSVSTPKIFPHIARWLEEDRE